MPLDVLPLADGLTLPDYAVADGGLVACGMLRVSHPRLAALHGRRRDEDTLICWCEGGVAFVACL